VERQNYRSLSRWQLGSHPQLQGEQICRRNYWN